MKRNIALKALIILGLVASLLYWGKAQSAPAVADGSAQVVTNSTISGQGNSQMTDGQNMADLPASVVESQPVSSDKDEVPQPAVMELDMTKEGNVTLDFREADIRNVLKVLSYKSGLNIIAGPEVVGMVNIQLKDVPWEKAMEVILSTYGYGYERKGTIIMVTTIDNLKKRREDAKMMADQEPLSTETFVLTFAKAAEVKDSLDKMKTARGNVNYDKRTNSIIVTDVTSNLQLMKEVIKALDTVTPQVLIEAKIIETTLNNDENLGIDWTAQASLTGAKRATSLPWNGTRGINRYLPDPTSEATSTFTYGTVDFSTFQAILKMLKTRSDTHVVSNPKIVTMDNQPAKITVGKQYPVPNYTFNEQQAKLQVSGWNYMDIGVIFNVTPHINNAGMVTLELEPSVTDIVDTAVVENTSMPVLSTESAKTTVMIEDGKTLVIAGLIKTKNTEGRSKIPILGDIPILGFPFQKKTTTVVKSDLLIFLTPHIITPTTEQSKTK
ncbi:MAG: hypothetical protein HGA80_04850 [Candidatus Omnitrophica bacterium]|nr:hypothetical protein [Candidatus Omnitrophota bacterium]